MKNLPQQICYCQIKSMENLFSTLELFINLLLFVLNIISRKNSEHIMKNLDIPQLNDDV